MKQVMEKKILVVVLRCKRNREAPNDIHHNRLQN